MKSEVSNGGFTPKTIDELLAIAQRAFSEDRKKEQSKPDPFVVKLTRDDFQGPRAQERYEEYLAKTNQPTQSATQ